MRRLAVLATLASVAVVTACGGTSTSQPGTGSPAKQITVFAAASLTNAFTAEAAAYRKKSGTTVRLSFAGSQELVAQLNQGAPADVVATADTATLQKLTAAPSASPSIFARNRLVIAVPPGNPKHLSGPRDLARKDLVVVLAGPTVPAGKYAAQALAATGVTVHPKSLEDNVRGVLTKIELGEADAGIVYVTDAKAAGAKVATVPLPTSPVASYPAVALHSEGRGFVDFLLTVDGQAILAGFGFLPPT
jgi:molybdate transport system substrate-binding protein